MTRRRPLFPFVPFLTHSEDCSAADMFLSTQEYLLWFALSTHCCPVGDSHTGFDQKVVG
ncbi:unnamed protein product, partial [Closterium sp. NIES-53]